MKVEMRGDGSLRIKPENTLEHYALNKWSKEWAENKVTLTFELDHPHMGDEAIMVTTIQNDVKVDNKMPVDIKNS